MSAVWTYFKISGADDNCKADCKFYSMKVSRGGTKPPFAQVT